ncbi:MAG: class I SAM-dependent methyltransferase [Thermoplasmatales archaeon]
MISKEFRIVMDKLTGNTERTSRIMRESLAVWEYVHRKIGRGRYWQITKDEVRVLYSLIAARRPKVVIETGMGPGVSTTSILSGLKGSGKLISIDPGEPYGKGDKDIGFVIPEELKKDLIYVKGRTSDKLNEVLEKTGMVDFFFHDSDHSYENVIFELETVFPYLSSNYLIVIDNYNWSDAPAHFAKNHGLRLLHIADDMALITE